MNDDGEVNDSSVLATVVKAGHRSLDRRIDALQYLGCQLVWDSYGKSLSRHSPIHEWGILEDVNN